LRADGSEQPLLVDHLGDAAIRGPIVKAHDDDRDVGEIDERSDAVAEDELARSDFADAGVVDYGHRLRILP
jgi:hypothetical protein